jgi:DNA-binding transcriptional LysR family regulator
MLAIPGAWNIRTPRVKLSDFRDRPWIMPHPTVAPDQFQLHIELCRSAGFEPRITGYAEDALTGRMMLACGMGVTFSSADSHRHGPHTDVAYVEGVSAHFSSEFAVAWAKGSNSGHIADFLRFVAEADAPA